MVDEANLITNLAKKSLPEYRTLYYDYYARLVLFARKFTGDQNAAMDVVQDTFLTLWEKADELNIHSSYQAYLFRTVKNKALNYKRHEQIVRNVHAELNEKISRLESSVYKDIHDPYHSLLELEIDDRVEKVIDNLPEKCKEVFWRSRRDFAKNKEIAEDMGISVKMVEKYISKALRVLRVALSDYLRISLMIWTIYNFLG